MEDWSWPVISCSAEAFIHWAYHQAHQPLAYVDVWRKSTLWVFTRGGAFLQDSRDERSAYRLLNSASAVDARVIYIHSGQVAVTRMSSCNVVHALYNVIMDVIHCCHPLAIIVSQFTVFPRNDRLCYTVKSISRMKVCLRTVPVRQKLPHVVKTTNLKVICQKFLERGHVYMEVDSMHAATEFAKKSVPVFPTHEWQYIFRAAWKQKPYDVVPLAHTDFWIWSTCPQQ